MHDKFIYFINIYIYTGLHDNGAQHKLAGVCRYIIKVCVFSQIIFILHQTPQHKKHAYRIFLGAIEKGTYLLSFLSPKTMSHVRKDIPKLSNAMLSEDLQIRCQGYRYHKDNTFSH